jgi:hypothetical protein
LKAKTNIKNFNKKKPSTFTWFFVKISLKTQLLKMKHPRNEKSACGNGVIEGTSF